MKHLRAWAHHYDTKAPSRRDPRRPRPAPACMGMRWVDDRWRVVRAATYRQVYQLYVVDIGTYSGAPWQAVQGLAALCGAQWHGSLCLLSGVAQAILGFICTGIGQTVEDASSVVGFDVGFEWLNHPARPLLCDDLSEGVHVGPEPLRLVARLTTKVGSLLSDAQATASSPFPRFSHRSLDMRASPERIGGAIQWMVRCADMCWHGGFVDGPPAELERSWLCAEHRSPTPSSGLASEEGDFVTRTLRASAQEAAIVPSVAWMWLRGPVIGLYRELSLSGWTLTDVTRVLYRACATTRDRVPTTAMTRRLRVLNWFLREAHALWSLFAK